MAKIAIVGDTHWGVRNDSPVFLDYFKKSVEEFFLPIIEENNVQTIIHLGDLVDRRKYVNYNTAYRLRNDFLKRLQGYRVEIIAGNHDEYYKDTYRINALDELVGDRYPNITVYTEPKTIITHDTEICLLPWITPDNEAAVLEEIKNTTATLCMAHLELIGFEMHKGKVSEEGTDASIFSKFQAVYTGHYHHRSSNENVHYIGAFAEHIWSDHNDPRGFIILDTETLETTFYRNPFRIFHMLPYDDVKHPDIIQKTQAFDFSRYRDCYVKVVCKNKTNPFAFDVFLDKLYKECPADITVVEDANMFTDMNPDELVDEAQDTISILDTYISNLTLPVDTDTMKDYMREVYVEALSLEDVE